MSNNSKFRKGQGLLMFFVLLGMGLMSCRDQDEVKPKTISDVVSDNDSFSIFRMALRHAELYDALKTNYLTLFAPSDSAFRVAGIANEEDVYNFDADSLRNILSYFVLDNKYSIEDIPQGDKQKFRTINGGYLFLSRRGNDLTVNTAHVISGDFLADNGVVHIMDQVLKAPSGKFSDWVKSDRSFSLLAAALARLPGVDSTLWALVNSDTATFTFLAPSNQAFADNGVETEEAIDTMDPDLLVALISNHILPEVVFSQEFENGEIGSLRGAPIHVTVIDGKVQFISNNSGGAVPSEIVEPDVVTRNGVVHGINRLLVP